MSFEIVTIEEFDKDSKQLNSKYPSLKNELIKFAEELKSNPFQGIPLGNSCYKIRLAIKSKGKGKRGGARIITHVKIIANTVYLLSIYNKGEKDDISDKELKLLVKQASQQ